MSSIQDVLEGRAKWAVVRGDNKVVLPTLPDKSVAHVITDPPYEAEAHTLQRQIKVEGGGGEFGVVAVAPLDFEPMTRSLRLWVASEAVRLSRAWFLAFCQAEGITPWREAMETGGGRWRRAGVWHKPDCMPQLTGDRWAQGFECIASCWCAAKGKSVWNGGGRSGVFVHNKEQFGGKAPHPTTKPLPLMLELVELFTDPDDLILDPFCGSGTTGVACLRLGRRFIGVELSEKYAAVAQERMEAESQGLTLRDARAGQLSLLGGA